MAIYAGFPEDKLDSVFITLDKMDKIGLEGVREELVAQGYDREDTDKYLALFDSASGDVEGIRYLKGALGDFLPAGTADNLETIMASVDATRSADFKIVFDPTQQQPGEVLKKTLLTEFRTKVNITRRNFANYEGICVGPKLSDGRQLLILVCDSQNQYRGVMKDWFRTVILPQSTNEISL